MKSQLRFDLEEQKETELQTSTCETMMFKHVVFRRMDAREREIESIDSGEG